MAEETLMGTRCDYCGNPEACNPTCKPCHPERAHLGKYGTLLDKGRYECFCEFYEKEFRGKRKPCSLEAFLELLKLKKRTIMAITIFENAALQAVGFTCEPVDWPKHIDQLGRVTYVDAHIAGEKFCCLVTPPLPFQRPNCKGDPLVFLRTECDVN